MLKEIKNYEGLYSIDSTGRVWSHKRKKYLKPGRDGGGYFFVNLCKEGKYKSKHIHRLVAEAFLPNPLNLKQVGHDDDDLTNNDLSNLYWTDSKENNNHGLHNSRLSKSHSKKIQCIETGVIYSSAKEACKKLGLNRGNLSMHLNGNYNSCGKQHFKFI